MRVQSTPKISRFLALPGSLSLFTAHAIIPPKIPKESGNKYQAPLTCSTGFHAAAPGAAIPLTGAPQFGHTLAGSAISLPQLWQNIARPLAHLRQNIARPRADSEVDWAFRP